MEGAKPAKDWAQDIGIPYSTMLKSIKSGDLEAFRFSKQGTFFVVPEAIQAWLKNAKQRAHTAQPPSAE